ncbi:low temperature requirement protein LtrA [Micromonospora pisi]|uniref:Low temperature requirement protein LtrA n=1 Tax=Micromonospora pisi TaxID=589240 RepID=A0A495JF16_9ACTN|nr:low temperature requirement protein A [Micromonospora pisi]RKR87311.1 low temperature requirement protein LtrA [Micromonospora pisi]
MPVGWRGTGGRIRAATTRWRGTASRSSGRVEPVELFIDVVFVFTLTQLTQQIINRPTFTTVGQVTLLFSLLWANYSGYAWLTNHVTPRRTSQKLLLLGGVAGFIIAAAGVPDAIAGRATVFSIGYLVLVCLHLILFTQSDSWRTVLRLAPGNLGAALLVLGSGFADGPLVYALWATAFVVQSVIPTLLWGTSRGGPPHAFHLSAGHFVERHGLLVVVAFGEEVAAIGASAGPAHTSDETVWVIILALTLPAALWWTYFADPRAAEQSLNRVDDVTRDVLGGKAYIFAHIPLLLGIVIGAAGIHTAVSHPEQPLDHASALALSGGVALFLVGIAWVRRVLTIRGAWRRLLTAAAALATIPLARVIPAAAQLAVVVGIVVVMLLLDTPPRHAQEAVRKGPFLYRIR